MCMCIHLGHVSDGCLSHKTAVALGALTQFLRFMMDPGTEDYQQSVHMAGTNHLLSPKVTKPKRLVPPKTKRSTNSQLRVVDDAELASVVKKPNIEHIQDDHQFEHYVFDSKAEVKNNRVMQVPRLPSLGKGGKGAILGQHVRQSDRLLGQQAEFDTNTYIDGEDGDDAADDNNQDNNDEDGDDDDDEGDDEDEGHPHDYYDGGEIDVHPREEHADKRDLQEGNLDIDQMRIHLPQDMHGLQMGRDEGIDLDPGNQEGGDKEYEQYIDNEEEENKRVEKPQYRDLDGRSAHIKNNNPFLAKNPKFAPMQQKPRAGVVEDHRGMNEEEDSYYDNEGQDKPGNQHKVDRGQPDADFEAQVSKKDTAFHRGDEITVRKDGELMGNHASIEKTYIVVLVAMVMLLIVMFRFIRRRRILIRYRYR